MGKSRVCTSTADLESAQSSNYTASDDDLKKQKKKKKKTSNDDPKQTKADIKIDQTSKDPRDGCCWQGEAFVNALKAMITRQMFLLHAMVVLWRATEVKGDLFWLFAIPYLALIIEAMIVLLYRRAKEWKW